MSGPLTGLRVLEFEAIGPVPHAVALLTSLGADVVRVQRPRTGSPRDPSPFAGRLVAADLTDPAAVADLLGLENGAMVEQSADWGLPAGTSPALRCIHRWSPSRCPAPGGQGSRRTRRWRR